MPVDLSQGAMPAGVVAPEPESTAPPILAAPDLSQGAVANQGAAGRTRASKVVALDLDGTLAEPGPGGMIGAPTKESRDLIRRLQAQGADVRIFTARANTPAGANMVKAWLGLHGFPDLPVTATKDPKFDVYLDDRAQRYEPGQSGKSLADGLMSAEPHWKDPTTEDVPVPASTPGTSSAVPLHQYVDMMTGAPSPAGAPGGPPSAPVTPLVPSSTTPVSSALNSLLEAEQAQRIGSVVPQAA